jgi:hypothetical protein
VAVALVGLTGAVANAYFEGGFAISVLTATAVAFAFGRATVLSFVTGGSLGADAPPVLVFATFVGISTFGGLLAWGVGNTVRGLKSGPDE